MTDGGTPLPGYDAILLAGGSGTRLGGIDKSALLVGGRSLAARSASALAGADRLILVGPRRDDVAADVVTREEPAGGGPAAAVAAGFGYVQADVVVVLAADLPFVSAAAVDRLRLELAARASIDVAIAIDGAGRDQSLLAAWRTASLRTALRGVTAGTPMRAVLAAAGGVERVGVAALAGGPAGADAAPPPTFDTDTDADLRAAWAWADRAGREPDRADGEPDGAGREPDRAGREPDHPEPDADPEPDRLPGGTA